jgi:CBS-domain-containing membrane protein
MFLWGTAGAVPALGLAVTLTGVLFAACCHTALQAHALTAAAGGQSVARQGFRCGGSFAVCFGENFVAHVAILLRLVRKAVFSHFFEPVQTQRSAQGPTPGQKAVF